MTEKHPLLPNWLDRLLTRPKADVSRLHSGMWFLLQLCHHGARELREHRARQMAAALTFHTIFGLIPVFILATLIFRAFGGAELLRDFVDQLLAAVRLHEVAGPEEGITLGEWARGAIDHLNANLSVRTIGVVGILVFAWAAIGLFTTIERAFNTICNAPENRSLLRRLPLYWTTITVGPALLYLSFHVQNRFVTWFQSAGIGNLPASVVGTAASLVATWLFLLMLYVLMPHTKIRLGAGLVGSLMAAVFWTCATWAFNGYVGWSFSKDSSAFRMLYGTLGLIPLFMLWVYLLWVIVLYGLELTNLLQIAGRHVGGTMPVRSKLPPLADPAAIIPVMQTVATRFSEGLTTSADQVVEHTRLSARTASLMLTALADAGLLRRVEEGHGTGFALGRPAEAISTKELMQVAQGLTVSEVAEESAAWDWVRRFRKAQLELGLHQPLADLRSGS